MNIFYCKHCKRIAFSIGGDGEITCCGEEMTLLLPKEKDAGNEKHLPVVEKVAENQIKVTVGSVLHPMTPEHWIQWVLVAQNDRYLVKSFLPSEQPTALFPYNPQEDLRVYEFCNLHGLWLTQIKK